ncbi:MAG: hypothetical protein OEY64_10530 [Nitrospinota bacterium]|nr:hypothetical protein [Nitrospinota bacterium]
MDIATISVSLDIATALSVVVAAWTYIRSEKRENKKLLLNNFKQMRIKMMTSLVMDLTDIIGKGNLIIRKVRAAQAGREVSLDYNDFIEFGMELFDYIGTNSYISFMVWATENENKILTDMQNLISDWNKDSIKAIKTKTKPPLFDELLDSLKEKTKELANAIKSEIGSESLNTSI